ncbi:hypothetical protein Tco_0432568 [Tanacetum coccineum]
MARMSIADPNNRMQVAENAKQQEKVEVINELTPVMIVEVETTSRVSVISEVPEMCGLKRSRTLAERQKTRGI